MQILENNYQKAREIECSTCNSKLLVDDTDIHYNGGDKFIICPCCNTHIFIDVPVPSKLTCENCHKEFDEPESYIGRYGLRFVRCPHCNYEQILNEGIELTPQNVVYPQHFDSAANGVPIKDEEINKWVKQCLDNLSKDQDFSLVASGNTYVIAYKSDYELHTAEVLVSKKYESTEVDLPADLF